MSGTVKESTVKQFIAITGSSKEVAKNLLEACNGNLDIAIGMHMDSDSGASEGPSVTAAGSDAGDREEVRAPIPQKNEVLVSEQPVYGFRSKKRKSKSVFDGFRDFQAEAKQQELQQMSGETSSKRKTLEELFRPPIDLLHRGSFQSARDVASSRNKWLMVNIQNVQEFPCQVLNRDVWSNAAVRAIVKDRFILWQVYHDTEEGQKYSQFYPVNHWPYVSIIDPRTGEKMGEWCKLDAMCFCDIVSEFLTANPNPGTSTTSDSPPGSPARKRPRESIIDSSEDSQLQAAIKASMSETQAKAQIIFEESASDDQQESDELETFTDSEEEEESELNSTGAQQSSGCLASHSLFSASTLLNGDSSCTSVNSMDSSSQSDTKINSMDSSSQSDAKINSMDSGSQSDSKGSINTNSDSSNWKQYLGSDNDEKTTILLRFPGGQRQQLRIPRSSLLRALTEYMVESGFSQLKHELLTNFPKRNLSQMDQDVTLERIGLFPQETVFVHENEKS